MTDHTLSEATALICGTQHRLRDPEGWVQRRLLNGTFTGFKIGRDWFMDDGDIAAAREALRNPRPTVEPEPDHGPVSVVGGLSARAARRLGRAS